MKTQKNNKKMLMAILIISLCSLLLFDFVSAQSAPLGVEGRVYDSDGFTEVFEGVPVKITNLNTNEFVVGETGAGSTGRFSFVLNWNKNDLINISASNPFNNSHVVMSLSGSIRGIELLLDMDFENVPPEFLSTPLTETVAEHNYTYLIETFDWNNDVVSYSLVESPDNMTLNDDLISWIPSRGQFGNHTVIINASDGTDYTLQEFVLEVFVINEAPNVTSTPITSIMRNELYQYEVEVVDEDYEFLEYSVFRGPSGMFFDDNVLTFEMDNSHNGEYVVIIDIKDRFNEVGRQIFLLMIDEPEPVITRRSPKKKTEVQEEPIDINEKILIVNGSSIFQTSKLLDENFFLKEILVDNSDFLSLEIKETTPLEERVKSINTRAYKYFYVRPNKKISDEVKITFLVKEEWMKLTGLSPEDIVLVKYESNEWVKLPIKYLRKDKNDYLFESLSQGLSLFAITHNEEVMTLERPVIINKINISNFFFGRIILIDELGEELHLSFEQAKKLQKDLSLVMINQRTKQEREIEILVLGNYLVYQENIFGEDEFLIKLTVKRKVLFEETITLTERINELNIALNKENVGYLFKETSVLRTTLLFISILLLTFLVIITLIEGKVIRK